MEVLFDTKSVESYRLFLKVKSLPRYSIRGHVAWFPDEYASRVGMAPKPRKRIKYEPHPASFDYQADIGAMSVEKGKFAKFMEPGRGKTLMFFDYCRHCLRVLSESKCVLIVSPLNVISQTMDECAKFYNGDLQIEQVRPADIEKWVMGDRKQRLGIVNYEAFKTSFRQGDLAALVCDEFSIAKSAYGKYGREAIRLGRGLDWKESNTGTPAPNDRIEYASQALFLDQCPTINAFLARYFVNRGQTDNRWEMKDHAVRPFYRDLSHWAFFLSDPAVYGWKDNSAPLPPIHIHRHHVPMTQEQEKLTMQTSGQLFVTKVGGITKRSSWGQIAKGWYRGKPVATNKPAEILRLVDSWPNESTIIWCIYNQEQEMLRKVFPDAANITGSTPLGKRMELIADFKAGRKKVLISKCRILGFGLNLQVATRQVFSGLADCYDESTEVLTREGWKSFGLIAPEDDVASVHPDTLEMTYDRPSRIFWEPYFGPMVRFNGQRNFDLLVTPNHRMFVKRCEKRFPTTGGQWHIRRANEIAESFKRLELRMRSCPVSWSGKSPDRIDNTHEAARRKWTTVRTVDTIDTTRAVLLAAWYLTEGHCRPIGSREFGRIVICQTDKNPECRAEIIALLRTFSDSVNDRTKDITIYSSHLASWLIEEFGHGSHFKRMPIWLKSLSSTHLTLLRETMLKGDGISYGRTYRTASIQLANDFQEVCLKTGCRASVHPRIGVCEAYPNDTIYDVMIAKENIEPIIWKRPEIVDYAGMIGCVTVPSGLIVVRRNGIPAVCGNSYELFFQAVKRSNRTGSTLPLNVHIPLTDIEEPMVDNVMRKAHCVQADTEEQERIFKECRNAC